jgi:hypothetical protein
MSRTDVPDAGLRAVARVRAIRERDSLLGLQTSLAEEQQAQQRVIGLEGRLATWSAPEGATSTFLAARAAGLALAVEARLAHTAAETAHTFTLASQDHWRRDKTRLSAVERLLERRATERRAEAARREARESDELASVRWLRDHAVEGPHSTPQDATS